MNKEIMAAPFIFLTVDLLIVLLFYLLMAWFVELFMLSMLELLIISLIKRLCSMSIIWFIDCLNCWTVQVINIWNVYQFIGWTIDYWVTIFFWFHKLVIISNDYSLMSSSVDLFICWIVYLLMASFVYQVRRKTMPWDKWL